MSSKEVYLNIIVNDSCQVSLFTMDKKLIEERKINAGELSQELLKSIDSMLKENKLDKRNLKLVLSNNMAKSYTGLRIALTAGNFLAYSLNIPIVKIDKRRLKAQRFISPVTPYYQSKPKITPYKARLN